LGNDRTSTFLGYFFTIIPFYLIDHLILVFNIRDREVLFGWLEMLQNVHTHVRCNAHMLHQEEASLSRQMHPLLNQKGDDPFGSGLYWRARAAAANESNRTTTARMIIDFFFWKSFDPWHRAIVKTEGTRSHHGEG